jgi:DNA-binding transcriptional ArsR family regulator
MTAGHRLVPDDPPDDDPDPAVLDLVSTPEAVEALRTGTAREVLARIYEAPATASAVAEAVDASLQTVHYHLGRLGDAGLVEVGATRYSSKGFEMDVYVPAHRPLVVVVGGDDDRRAVADAVCEDRCDARNPGPADDRRPGDDDDHRGRPDRGAGDPDGDGDRRDPPLAGGAAGA